MEHIAPLIQTLLWVGLIGAIVWRFNKPLYGLLVALQKRIESGSAIKAGPFEISQLRPQEADAQKRKVKSEIAEILEEEKVSKELLGKASVESRYFQAEDLALRAIQEEFGKVISRQVTAGNDFGFDGAFLERGQLNVVEVKYSYHKYSLQRAKEALKQVNAALHKYQWKNVRIILVLVGEDSESLQLSEEEEESLQKSSEFPVVIRQFVINELIERYFIGAKEG